jgi:hypothetical protein
MISVAELSSSPHRTVAMHNGCCTQGDADGAQKPRLNFFPDKFCPPSSLFYLPHFEFSNEFLYAMSKDLKFFTKKKKKKFPGFWSRLVAFEIDANKNELQSR